MPLTRGQRLLRLREQKGVEQKEAAAAIGISRPYLSLLERDKKGRILDHLRGTFERAADYYGVIPEYLLVDTPQEYIQALVERLGPESPQTFGQRLQLVLSELKLRWGDEFAEDRIADALGSTVEILDDYLGDRVLVPDSVLQQISTITGAAADWLAPKPDECLDTMPAMQRVVEKAVASGLQPAELEALVQVWIAAKNMQKPSG